MQEIIDGWAVPDVDVFTPDLAPVCAADTPENDEAPPIATAGEGSSYGLHRRCQTHPRDLPS